MKYLVQTVLLTILIIWTLVTLFGIDPVEGNRNVTRSRGRVANRNARRGNATGPRVTQIGGGGRGSRSGRRGRGGRGNRNRGRGRGRGGGRGRQGRGGRRGSSSWRQRRYERYGCEEIYLPMCKGMVSYTHTKLPNRFNHTTQAEVFRHLEPLMAYMDSSCSRNVRLLACATYLPKCHGRRPGMGPCKRTCEVAKRKCASTLSQQLSLEWDERFSCEGLPNRRCVRPMRDTRCRFDYPNCIRNQAVSACQNLTFTWGTLPNMFGQCHVQDINLELRQYESLLATNCHEHLNFLLCGVHTPFCVRNEIPFTFPCRELCMEVRQACESQYRQLNHNLTWPHKLQCHRYPASDNEHYQCVMPNEGATFNEG